jgi:hypothetical protein
MKIKKNIILFVAGLLVAGSVLSGCTQQGFSVSIVPQSIGDEATYTLKMTLTSPGSQDLSQPNTQTINGTIFTKVNGTKITMDGFGTDREAIEMYTKTTFETEGGQTQGYEISNIGLTYMDQESKFPLKSVMDLNMRSNTGSMGASFEFYTTEKMYGFLYSSLSNFYSPGISPSDVSSAFEGKTIKKGDTGTITIANMTITWTALGDEKVKNYDCEKIQFSLPVNTPSQGGMPISITSDYTVWLTSSFPNLIKMSGTVISEATSTFGNYQTSVSIDMVLESSKRGITTITWGSSKPSFSEENLFGEYKEWNVIPTLGDKTSTISYSPEEAVAYAQTNSPDLLSYLTSHSAAYVTVSRYERKNNTETWNLTFGDETLNGYEVNLTYDGVKSAIDSEGSIAFSTIGKSKSSLSQNLLTFSGCESIFSQYAELDPSLDMQIYFISDISSQSSSSELSVLPGMYEMLPSSVYTMAVGNTYGTVAAIDAETGQMIFTMHVDIT